MLYSLSYIQTQKARNMPGNPCTFYNTQNSRLLQNWTNKTSSFRCTRLLYPKINNKTTAIFEKHCLFFNYQSRCSPITAEGSALSSVIFQPQLPYRFPPAAGLPDAPSHPPCTGQIEIRFPPHRWWHLYSGHPRQIPWEGNCRFLPGSGQLRNVPIRSFPRRVSRSGISSTTMSISFSFVNILHCSRISI